jgi:hypothetical protein
MKRSFVDSGVLIAAARGNSDRTERAFFELKALTFLNLDKSHPKKLQKRDEVHHPALHGSYRGAHSVASGAALEVDDVLD